MIQGKDRYIIFGIGVLIGTFIFAFFMQGKRASIDAQLQHDIELGFAQDHRVLPGQIFSARNPLHTGPALETQDLPINDNNIFQRIIIAEDSSRPNSPYMRYLETLWKDPDTDRERLIRRQLMHADRIVLRINPATFNHDSLQQFAQDNQCSLIGQGRTPSLYEIQLPSHTISAIPQAIEKFLTLPFIDTALPAYIIDTYPTG